MDEMVGYCGYRCSVCAARSPDPAVRQKLVDGWKKIFGHQNYTADNVFCEGCKSGGKIADKSCKARPCAKEKGVDFCADCTEFPCDKVRPLLATAEGMLIFCRPKNGSISEEEYDLCMRQFDSMSGIVAMMAKSGKLAPWVKRRIKPKD